MRLRAVFSLLMLVSFLTDCQGAAPISSSNKVISVTPTASATSDSSLFLSMYVFPASIDPIKRYMFYLHGKIIEDQGIPAVSSDYGEYEYEAILERLASHGFAMISEQRQKNTDGVKYAERIAGQVTELLDAGIPAKDITVVGASKGAAIAIIISNNLANKELNFVLMGTCDPETVQLYKQQNIFLYGNVLTIRDAVDGLSGSCQELFAFSAGNIARHEELVLNIGSGHGILYEPLDEWIIPAVQWAEQ